MIKMFCAKCGSPVDGTTGFCPNCGTAVGKAGSNVNSAFGYFKDCWRRYAQFTGRARRSEYWYFVLFNFLVAIGVGIVDAVIGAGEALSGLYSLAVLIPGLAVSVRRLHDIGKSGWWVLIAFIPIVGAIVFLVFMAKDSDPGDNLYGANPKAS